MIWFLLIVCQSSLTPVGLLCCCQLWDKPGPSLSSAPRSPEQMCQRAEKTQTEVLIDEGTREKEEEEEEQQ